MKETASCGSKPDVELASICCELIVAGQSPKWAERLRELRRQSRIIRGESDVAATAGGHQPENA